MSGIAVAAFTFTLWQTTKGLIISGENTAREQKSLIDKQITIMARQTEIANRQHIADHRPRILIRLGRLYHSPDGRYFLVWYQIANTGGSDAKIVGAYISASIMDAGMPSINFTPNTENGQFGIVGKVFAPGESLDLFQPGANTVAEVEAVRGTLAATGQSPKKIVFNGTILYEDEIGIRRRTGFWREHDFVKGRFVAGFDTDGEFQD